MWLNVIWQVGAELPMDSDEADEENKMDDGKTLLYIFERGYCKVSLLDSFTERNNIAQEIYL
jgi:hypothetical protein